MQESTLILVLNAGSSSLKFSLLALPQEHEILKGIAERLGETQSSFWVHFPEKKELELPPSAHLPEALSALKALLSRQNLSPRIAAIAHRVVHGGERFKNTTHLNGKVLDVLKSLIPLAPLHNPANIQGIEAALNEWPDLPQYAVFDTAFHQSMPKVAYRYALPSSLYTEDGIRRYGFHGSSHQFVSARLKTLDPHAAERVITAHLGNGCSMAAILNGKSVDTSMGMTPLEGLVMGTRCGDLDPGVVLYLLSQKGLSTKALNRLLNKESGLLGLSGLSNDVRSLDRARQEGHTGAALALEIFAYRAAKAAAALCVGLGGLDCLVFTGGIGENSAWVRERIVAHLGFLGLLLDPELNFGCQGQEARISLHEQPAVWVIPTQEERMIARESFEKMKAENK
jgi:acetate kinase